MGGTCLKLTLTCGKSPWASCPAPSETCPSLRIKPCISGYARPAWDGHTQRHMSPLAQHGAARLR
eukprot:scaffold285815_cov33-Tisochrysis_lutea.AAC.3